MSPTTAFKQHFLALAVFCLCHLPASASACNAPEAVCNWADSIVGIKTPNMIASGTMFADGFIVTNRHVAEDHARVMTRDIKGRIRSATPLAHNFAANLVILRTESANGVPDNAPALSDSKPQQLHVVAFDQGRNGPGVYGAGDFALYPAADAISRARIHTNARASRCGR